jgi:hydroxyacylglutathione hydrolase
MNPLTLDEVLALQSSGAQVVDTREPGEFASAHLKGTINIGLGGQYATWAGTLLDRTHPIVIIASPGRESESALRLGRIGFDHIAGYLKDGLQSLSDRADLTVETDRLSAPAAAEWMGGTSMAEAPVLVDVRAPREREQKHIAGSVAIPLNHFIERIGEIPKGRAVLVHCAGGYRSSIAASLLQRAGFDDVSELAGGIAAWETAKLPVKIMSASAST